MELDINNMSIMVVLPKGLKDSFDHYMFHNPPRFGVKTHVDNFYYIMSKIHVISISKSKFKNLDKIPISSTILMHEIGRHYRKYLNYLISAGFIESDNHYIVTSDVKQGKCKCYSLTGQYKHSKQTEKIKISSKSIIGHYLKWKNSMFSKVADDDMLSKLFDMVQKFHIDTNEAEKYLRDLQKTDSKITDQWIKNELDKCNRINNKDAAQKLMFIVRDPYQRIHTNITNLSKRIRENFLYLDGEKVKSIDIVSSQASLLYLMMKQERDRIEETAKSPDVANFAMDEFVPDYDVRDKYVNRKNSYEGDPIRLYLGDTSHVSMLGLNSYEDALSAVDKDLTKMQQILSGEGIYEYFQTRWHINYNTWLDRDVIKQKWIAYVFGKPNASCKKMRYIWNTSFPMLTRMIDNFKINDYRILAHKLQRTEADLVFNKVCKAIDTKIGINYGTVHDSLIVPEHAFESAKEIFSKVLRENGIITGVK